LIRAAASTQAFGGYGRAFPTAYDSIDWSFYMNRMQIFTVLASLFLLCSLAIARQEKQKATVKDFAFEIGPCKRSKTIVVCEPVVTNTSADDSAISINVSGEDTEDWGKMTRAFDESGNEYIPQNLSLGSVARRGGIPAAEERGAACSFGGCRPITNTLIPRTRMKIRIAFPNVKPEANMLTLRVYFLYNGEKLNADFREVPIVR
jgi:hypothetical protein